ncbi:MAG: phytanoyl-CoA dioxygenase family protein [Alicyclobacillus herbarius]|uniref:phytanoyl-CoA dioxygenase family protein n=1 Tax=Alicyclobacillus herbarius TaxID=122960 RepID=UPI0004117933|nr:phytanoyl-CoA dioxygenase family protein [Alicyclobacillus herbarius]MCL6633648.1 phytanoyl-CoA dioxygenase family protein [Alicyclobacillus herbarius]
MNGALTESQINQFQRDGYLVLEGVFDEHEVQRMREEANYILELILNSSIAHERRSGRLDWTEYPDGTQHVRKIQPINDLSLFLNRLSEDPRLIEPMRQIMGCDPLLMEEKLNYKQPLETRIEGLSIEKRDDRFPIHNDWAYFAAQNYPQDIISSAISIDACTVDNGPLHVWPGSHREHLQHVAGEFGLEVAPGLIDPHGGVDILTPPGSVMFFHALLVHNSRPNSTPRPRRMLIYSHYPSRVNLGLDIRNGPARLRESPWEHEYLRMKMSGEYADRFKAPVYDTFDVR